MLCLSDNPFIVEEIDTSTIEKKKARLVHIKKSLKTAQKNGGTCHVGDQIAEELKNEQYLLSREL